MTDPSDNTTLLTILDLYDAAGYSSQFAATDEGALHCFTCRNDLSTEQVTMQSMRRLEGASDPADMLAVIALICGICGALGTATLNYGPEASAGDAYALRAVEDLRASDDLPAAGPPGEESR